MKHPIYCLPGALGNTDFWHPITQQLSEYHCQILSYPGFHHVPALHTIQHFNQLSDHVLAQMSAPSIILAQSMGGLFAIRHALENPHLVKALILIATSGGIHLDEITRVDWRESYKKSNPDIPLWFTENTPNYQAQLHQINIPILLIWADQDPISPLPIAHRLQSYLPQAQLKIISSCDHHFAALHATEVATTIDMFIRRQRHLIL